jgi:pentatricopeptide repeat protein
MSIETPSSESEEAPENVSLADLSELQEEELEQVKQDNQELLEELDERAEEAGGYRGNKQIDADFAEWKRENQAIKLEKQRRLLKEDAEEVGGYENDEQLKKQVENWKEKKESFQQREFNGEDLYQKAIVDREEITQEERIDVAEFIAHNVMSPAERIIRIADRDNFDYENSEIKFLKHSFEALRDAGNTEAAEEVFDEMQEHDMYTTEAQNRVTLARDFANEGKFEKAESIAEGFDTENTKERVMQDIQEIKEE